MKKALFFAILLMFCLSLKLSFAYYIPNSANCVLAFPFDENTSTKATDRALNINNGTLIGSPTWVTGVYDGAINLTANSKYVSIVNSATLNYTGSTTWMFWMRATTDDRTIWANVQNGSPYTGSAIYIGSGGTAHKLIFYNSVAGTYVSGVTTVDDNALRHITVVYNSTNSSVSFYLNGTLDAIRPTGATLGVYNIYKNLGINQVNTSSTTLIGFLDEFKIFNISLTQSQIVTERDTPINSNAPSTSNGTSISLWIDNAQANISTSCSGTNHNYTAQINTTNLPVSLMYNNTLVNTSNTTVSFYASLIAGLWNWTANYTGNATYGSSMTWLLHNITKGTATANLTYNLTPPSNNTTCMGTTVFINCSSYELEDGVKLYNDTTEVGNQYNYTSPTAGVYWFHCNWTAGDCYNAGEVNRTLEVLDCSVPEEPPLNYSNGTTTLVLSTNDFFTQDKYCKDNNTLYENKTMNIISNGSILFSGYMPINETCEYGCDNVTQSCKPPVYIQNLVILVVIGAIMLLIYKVIR